MYTFIASILLLFVGYYFYGRYVERTFGISKERKTPAYTQQDGVDFLPLSKTKNALIQLLNIAGIGPIFGPIMGALYGPVAFVWIVIGAIFAGAVHDYLIGMISIRENGAHLPQLAGKYLGKIMKHMVNLFAMLLLLLVGTVFVISPAHLLANLLDHQSALTAIILLIFGYYILATILPIDKIIGRFYPAFGLLLMISTVGIGIGIFVNHVQIPELTLENMHPRGLAVFPLLFLTISCGALSGFHATQSPIISRTTQTEVHGRRIFYGMMIGEAVIAMIWAGAAMGIFDGVSLQQIIQQQGAAEVVSIVSKKMLGAGLGSLAVIGIIALPITSGDTAFRSLRMIIADYLNIDQKKLVYRILIVLPLFVIAYFLVYIDFSVLWRYFSWANQLTAMVALWTSAMYLLLQERNYWIAKIPALFISMVCVTYILNAPIGFGLDLTTSTIASSFIVLAMSFFFYRSALRQKRAPSARIAGSSLGD